MSEENVERFMKGMQAFNRGDIAGVLRIMDPEIVWDHRLADLQGKLVGPDAVTGWFSDLYEHFQVVEIDCPDVRDLGDRVLRLGTICAIGRGSGVVTELTFATVARFRDGLMTEHHLPLGGGALGHAKASGSARPEADPPGTRSVS